MMEGFRYPEPPSADSDQEAAETEAAELVAEPAA